MTNLDENLTIEYQWEDTENYAEALSLEFLRDSRRYCRKLDCEVEE